MLSVLRLVLTAILLLTTSCGAIIEPMPKGWRWGFKPRPLVGMRNFPSADTEYGKGFKDGCMVALDSTSKGLTSDLKSTFDYKRSLKGADYGNGWWDGFEQCVYITDWDVL